MEILVRYAEALNATGCKLMLVSASELVLRQLAVADVTEVVGDVNIYATDRLLGTAAGQARQDANAGISAHQGEAE